MLWPGSAGSTLGLKPSGKDSPNANVPAGSGVPGLHDDTNGLEIEKSTPPYLRPTSKGAGFVIDIAEGLDDETVASTLLPLMPLAFARTLVIR